jgi:hypothetical protein
MDGATLPLEDVLQPLGHGLHQLFQVQVQANEIRTLCVYSCKKLSLCCEDFGPGNSLLCEQLGWLVLGGVLFLLMRSFCLLCMDFIRFFMYISSTSKRLYFLAKTFIKQKVFFIGY